MMSQLYNRGLRTLVQQTPGRPVDIGRSVCTPHSAAFTLLKNGSIQQACL